MPSSHWTATDLPDLHGRNIIITGANSGIGRAAASALSHAGGAVTLAVRDVAKGAAAAASMSGTVVVRQLDLADLSSVRTFADSIDEPIDILIDNAGVMAVPEQRTVDGFEMQIGTNHLGHFALTNLLAPRVTDRIVVVSSELHRRGRIDLDDLNWERRRYKAWDAYAQSKLANLLFVLELERRLQGCVSPVRALAVHPGYAATNLQRHTGRATLSVLTAIGNRLLAQSDVLRRHRGRARWFLHRSERLSCHAWLSSVRCPFCRGARRRERRRSMGAFGTAHEGDVAPRFEGLTWNFVQRSNHPSRCGDSKFLRR